MKCEYFTDFIHAHVEKKDKNRIYIDKLMSKKLAEKSSASLPEIYSEVSSVDELVFSNLPDPVVIKLTNLASKRGVYILYKIKGGYFEQLRGKAFREDEIVGMIEKSFNPKVSKIISEQLVVGENGPLEIPFDYKLYTFDGVVEFILQIDRNASIDRVAFFDGKFEPIDNTCVSAGKKYVDLADPIKPKNYSEMIHVAEELSRKVDRPFISVDLYTSGDRAYLGELTPTPGGPYFGNIVSFSDAFDLYLGEKMADGYLKRGWSIPEIDSLPPARKKRGSC